MQTDSQGLAMGGFDVVAYFTEAAARPGRPEFALKHEGATYRFASASNRTLFQASPEKYLPQFHGYCAYALAKGKTTRCDPRRFAVEGGKLYVFSSASAQRRWSLDQADLVGQALRVWRALLE